MAGAKDGSELVDELEKRFAPNRESELGKIQRKLTGASLLDYSTRTVDPGQTLLGHRWLCRGGGAFVFGPSGLGKSVLAIQGAVQWACAEMAFGIKPAGPLRSLIIQAEDDEGDVIEMAKVVTHLGLDEQKRKLVRENTHIEFVNDLSGERFLEVLDNFLSQRPVDLVWLNPYSTYLGASVLEDGANAKFLRNGLNPILYRHGCGAIIIHHTPKTNFRDTTDWKHTDWMYAGAGAAVLTNWARAIIVVDPTAKPGLYRFMAAKRHNRIGWPSFDRYFAHSTEPGKLLWVEVASEEVKSSKGTKSCQPADLLSLIPEQEPISQEALTVEAKEILGIGEKKCRQYANILADKGEIFLHKIRREGAKSAVGYARTKPVLEPDGKQDEQADAI
jgi:AAA domain